MYQTLALFFVFSRIGRSLSLVHSEQILKISDDGIEKHIVVKPKDPVFGITIKFLETGHPQFSIPDISIEDTAIMLKNLEEAKAFCSEFYEKRDEFIQGAI